MIIKKTIAFLALILLVSETINAQITSPGFKITYATVEENEEEHTSQVTHEIYVNEQKIKIVMPNVFPNRIFLANKKEDQGLLVYPSLSSYVLYELSNADTSVLQFIPHNTKTIAGYPCKLAQLKITDEDGYLEEEILDIWYSEDLPKVYWSNFDELKGLPGAALQISKSNGLSLLAQSVHPVEMNDQDFAIPEDYQQIDEMAIPEDKAPQVAEDLFLYQDSISGYYGLRDHQGKKITDAEYLDIGLFQYGLSIAQHSNQKFGILDLSVKAVIPFIYDYVMNDYAYEQFLVGLDEKYGLLDSQGKLVIPTNYDYISFIQDGYAIFSSGDQFGMINDKNEIVIPAGYPVIVGNNSTHFITIDDDHYTLGDIKSNKIMASGYDYISTTEEPNLFLALKDDKYGFLDQQGKVKIPFIYSNASPFVDGKAYVITLSDEAILINTKGEKIDTVDAVSDGTAEYLEALEEIERVSRESLEATEKE